MKLKKIAALALAGVMAVSMLAGCATNKPDPDPNPGEGQGTVTTTGYSAELEDAVGLSDKLSKYISFADSTADQAALEAALGNLSSETVKALLTGGLSKNVVVEMNDTSAYADLQKSMDKFKEYAEIDNHGMNSGNLNFNYLKDTTVNPKTRTAALFVVNGSVDTAEALKQVAALIDGPLAKTPDENTGAIRFDYTYVLSASAVTKTMPTSYEGSSNTLTFIAVTATRTATLQK